jgi:hypothetical protein
MFSECFARHSKVPKNAIISHKPERQLGNGEKGRRSTRGRGEDGFPGVLFDK